MLFPINAIFFLKKLVQYNEYLVSSVDTDGLVLKHQAISNHSAEHPYAFPAVYGLNQSDDIW